MLSGAETSLYVKKRERTQNWVPEEKSALFELVKVHVNAIENKKLDAASAAQKNFAWSKIYHDFRGIFSTDRDNDKIKAQWTRMKAQARLELYTFAAQVKVIGMEQASKKLPSKLSIAVWRLLQTLRKSDCDGGENSDESSQDADVTSDVDAILDKLPSPDHPEMWCFPQIKTEPTSDVFDDHFITGSSGYSGQRPVEIISRKRKSTLDGIHDNYQSTHAYDSKKSRGESSGSQSYNNAETSEHKEDNFTTESSISPEDIYQPQISADLGSWKFEMAKKEHKLKLQMLNTELERASLQKQTAINELRTSSIKRQMTEAKADEFYSQTLMSGQPGSGAGRGGGGGGSIRDAGGSFGKMEAAHEDQYFYNQQKEQLQHLREGLHDEISFHEEQIKRHQEAINRHKDRIGNMEKQ